MIKIITAMGNPILNQKLKNIEKYEVLSQDIQYKEGILEILEKNINIDVLIINDTIPGEIGIKELINNILSLKNKIEIIIFSNSVDNEIVNFLNSKRIFKIYSNLEDLTNSLIDISDNKTIDITNEIDELKQLIINKENIEILDKKNSNSRNIESENKKEVIVVAGSCGVRKKCVFHNNRKIC